MAGGLDRVDDDKKFNSVLSNVGRGNFRLLVTFRILDVIGMWKENSNIINGIDGLYHDEKLKCK